MSNGVIYCADGKKYYHEALKSAESLKKHNPEISVSIFTNQNYSPDTPFDHYYSLISDNAKLNKIYSLINTPYSDTLFLDSDTRVCDTIKYFFELSPRFDMAFSHATTRFHKNALVNQPLIPMFSTGVIFYRYNKKTLNLLDRWYNEYSSISMGKGEKIPDQITFRSLIINSNVSYFIIPPEFNFFISAPGYIGGNSKAYILHGRNHDLEFVEKIANYSKQSRVFLPSIYSFLNNNFFITSPKGNLFNKCLRFMNKLFNHTK